MITLSTSQTGFKHGASILGKLLLVLIFILLIYFKNNLYYDQSL